MKVTLIVVAALIALAKSAPFDLIEPRQVTENYRLPKNVLPSNYKLDITPHFEARAGVTQFTFDGVAIITLNTSEVNVTSIVLHSNNLAIKESEGSVTLVEANNDLTRILITDISYNNITHKLELSLASPLAQNTNYLLTFRYVGQLSTDMYGFYRSSYVANGTQRWIGTTQMQPTHARRVFPCFDEPSFKATFDVTINRPSSYIPTLSNTKIIKTVTGETANITSETFATTPKMSTYLLAFIVSDFRVRENAQKTFGVLARPDAYHQTEYAQEVGPKLLNELDKFFDYPYFSVDGIDKMHMAALPDFNAGAMENWGLLTYRETALLYDPDVSTAKAQERVATVITHEQAHMWFGDLVTCDWWSYTWLNEGFARYFQYFGTALVENTWSLGEQFVVEQLQSVFGMDSLENTHPMTYEVNSPAQVSGIFDSISYNKGASIIRMVEHMIGANAFKTALRKYLKANEFGTTTPDKLYRQLQDQSSENISIATLMNTWTTQAGYPVVTVVRDANKKDLTITQKRFLLKNKEHTDNTFWQIPLSFASNVDNKNFQDTKQKFILNNRDSLKIELLNETEWIIFNVQQTGYYRVNYDEATWLNINYALKNASHSNIHVLNRAQIVDDSMNLARSNLIEYKVALNILQYLKTEENYLPWLAAFNNLAYVTRRFDGKNLVLLKKHVLELIDNIYNKLTFTEKSTDSRLDIYNRATILSYACKYGHTECVKLAKESFAKLDTTSTRVPVNVRPAVYCTAVAEGGSAEFEFLWQKFLTENVAAEQVLILSALGCTKNAALLKLYMDRILSDSVRLQDKSSAFAATYSGQEQNINIVFDYVITNHTDIAASFGSVSNVASILSNIAARFTTKEQIEQLEKFYTANKAIFGTSVTIPNAINDARFNLEWADKHVPEIVKFISGSSRFTSVTLLLVLSAVSAYFM